MKKFSIIALSIVAFFSLVLPYPKACSAHAEDPVKTAKTTIKVYKDDPQKVMEIYLNLKKWRQERLNGRIDDLDVYETYLQEHKLLAPELTRDDRIKQYFLETITMRKDDPKRLKLACLNSKNLLQKSGYNTDFIDAECDRILKEQEEAP